MLLLVQYIDSEFPDYDIVNKNSVLEDKYGKQKVILVRAECDESVHRAVVIQESENEFQLKALKDTLLKEHRGRHKKKKWRKKTCRDTNKTDSSINCSSIKEPQSSPVDNQFHGDSDAKVDQASVCNSNPMQHMHADDMPTHSHAEGFDEDEDTGPDQILVETVEKIVSNGCKVKQEMDEVLNMLRNFKMNLHEESNDSAIDNSNKSETYSPELRRSKRLKRSSNSADKSSVNSSKRSDKRLQKKILLEHAKNIRQNIINVLNVFDQKRQDLETYTKQSTSNQ